MRNELLQNLDKLHTTELGIIRIKKNLSLETDDAVAWCRMKYVNVDGCMITVNAYSYTIITAHKERKHGREK